MKRFKIHWSKFESLPDLPFLSYYLLGFPFPHECVGGVIDRGLEWEIRERSLYSNQISLHSFSHK